MNEFVLKRNLFWGLVCCFVYFSSLFFMVNSTPFKSIPKSKKIDFWPHSNSSNIDSDGDGISDDSDIDDDNDGIRDIDECIIKNVIKVDFSNAGDGDGGSLSDWNQITNTSSIAAGAVKLHGSGDLAPNIGISTSNFNNASFNNDGNTANWAGLTQDPYFIAGADDIYYHGSGKPAIITFSGLASNAKYNVRIYSLIGDNPNVSDALSVSDGDSFQTISNTRGFRWAANTLEEAGTVFNNVSTNSSNEIVITFSTTYIVLNAIIIEQIECDTDGDGIANSLDLDADGDGCADAFEAGHNQDVQADSTIAGPYGNNGLAASVENNDNADATINYTIARTSVNKNDFLNTAVTTACADNDKDGISDNIDIDDDNDGILDMDEGFQCMAINLASIPVKVQGTGDAHKSDAENNRKRSAKIGDIYRYDNVLSLGDRNFCLLVEFVEIQFDDSDDRVIFHQDTDPTKIGKFRLIGGNPNGDDYFIVKYTLIDAATGIIFPVSNLDVTLIDIDGNGKSSGGVLEIGGFKTSEITHGPILNGLSTDPVIIGGFLNDAASGNASYLSDFITFRTEAGNKAVATSGSNDVNVTFKNTGSFHLLFGVTGTSNDYSNGRNTIISIQLCSELDSDNDGVADRLDRDSDNDGCSDAAEAGHNQTVLADAAIAGPYGDNGLAMSVENNDNANANINYTIANNGGINDFQNALVSDACIEICDNGIDDDGDGLVDKNDGECCRKVQMLIPSFTTAFGLNGSNLNIVYDRVSDVLDFSMILTGNSPTDTRFPTSSNEFNAHFYLALSRGLTPNSDNSETYPSFLIGEDSIVGRSYNRAPGDNFSIAYNGMNITSEGNSKTYTFSIDVTDLLAQIGNTGGLMGENYGIWLFARDYYLTSNFNVYDEHGGITNCVTNEICDNGIDDDGDGLIDCADPDCSSLANCLIDLELDKSVTPVVIDSVGETVVFTLVLSNKGPATATGIRVADQLPASYDFISDNGGGTYNSTSGIWTIPSLNSGDSTTLTINARVVNGLDLINIAQVVAADQQDVDSTPNNDDGDQSEDDESAAAAIFDCVLGDEIWLDLNADGIKDDIEIGIANVPVCVVNQTTVVLNSITYPPGTFLDTVLTDVNGMYAFSKLPSGDWQIKALYDTGLYVPTYDADGGVLNEANFTLFEGKVLSFNNSWCANADCILELDFGMRLAGDNDLGGNICIDDGSGDGICSTGGEQQLDSIQVLLYNGSGRFFGAIRTLIDGSYQFPYLLNDNYIVGVKTLQDSLSHFHFQTETGDTPADTIRVINNTIFQIVHVIRDIAGIDYAFARPISCSITAINDVFTTCPSQTLKNSLAANDFITANTVYTLRSAPANGHVQLQTNGAFEYTPTSNACTVDEFTYEICLSDSTCCETGIVQINLTDTVAPQLVNIPDDLIISCDEALPPLPLVSAYDNCPSISIDVIENNTQGEDGCSLYNYNLTKIWTATDVCGNAISDDQTVRIQDHTAPDIFRIYTLPNGKKMVAGVMENVRHRWKTISLPIVFETPPLVFSQVITANEATPVTTRLRNISLQQFELRLQEEGEDNIHNQEKVAWIAIEEGNEQHQISLEAWQFSLNHDWKNINFEETYTSAPNVFAEMQTIYDSDPASIRFRNMDTNKVELRIEEEISTDIDVTHTKENIAFLAIEKNIDLLEKEGNIFGETGTINVDNHWQTVYTNHHYYNPIVIAGVPQSADAEPGMIAVRNVTLDSFQIKFQEWAYLDGQHSPESVAYLVVEGSIPLDASVICDTGTDGLELGKDIVALDNCDVSVYLNYRDTVYYKGADKLIQRYWSATDECGNSTQLNQEVVCHGVAVQLKTYLQGALIGSQTEGLMRDDLRKKDLIPLEEPYTEMNGFEHRGSGGGEKISRNLLNITGAKAIVDWVFITLSPAENADSVVSTCSALLQRDGNIVTAQGDSLIAFHNIPQANYYVGIRHRNHLGVQSLDTYYLSNNQTPFLDYSYNFMPTRGKNPLITEKNNLSIWAGDLNNDGKVIFQGPQNDVFYMFLQIFLDEKNTGSLSNFISNDYNPNDFNLDGVTIFQGPNNDRALLLHNTILKHPENESFLTNFILKVKEGDN